MRGLILGLSVLAFATGCGGDNSTGPVQTGTLSVVFDAQTCSSGTAEIFVDGTSVGSYLWNPGVSRSISVQAGQHFVSAEEVGGTQTSWAPVSANVPAGGTFNVIFTC